MGLTGRDSAAGFADTYARQAATYDQSRTGGRETVEPLLAALACAPGRRVLDVGGGTGNYATAMRLAGSDVLVLDRSDDMLAVAAAKGLSVCHADATDLSEPDGSADAVTMIAILHQVPDWRGALREARRVLRPGGLLCLVLYTQEHLDGHFFLDYFPSARIWAGRDLRPLSDYLSELLGAEALPLQIRRTDDLTMQVMRRHPALALDPALCMQTSFFARLHREDPDGMARGLASLAADIDAGDLPAGYDADLGCGDATLLTWRKPG
jgi:ubiquinone/menaquinone biosynthesis C-methylase UbiE